MSRDPRFWRLKAPLAWFLGCALPAVAGTPLQTVRAVRVQPSPEGSRLVLELAEMPAYKTLTLKDPDRVVFDLEGVAPDGPLADIATRITPQDPCIASLRVGINRPGVTRLVIELKTAVRPEISTLKPMADYAHRLIIDLKGRGQPVPSVSAPAAPKLASSVNRTPQPVEPLPVPAETKRMVVVAIDAGHGGEDPGARGAHGTLEKTVTLSIARRVRAKIEQTDTMRAVMIREGDYFIPLHERVNKARQAQADIFVSIHADAFYKASARGSSVFVLSEKGGTSAAARWLAKKENDADLIGGVRVDVKYIFARESILDMSKDAQIRDSLRLARGVLEEVGGINDLHKATVESASFAVLKAPEFPSILIETAFISNPEEERKLTDDAHQDKIAAAIVAGLTRYLATNPSLSRRDKTAQRVVRD
ncbi:MAG: N-acetylmuramoyl-L-alanine amidase [Betaproteobacteria bacterium]|nr:MAG: N-acetylmuramoyl-L-alanine amidase [Betaproteobacteria bacterium]